MKELMILLLKAASFGLIVMLFDKILNTYPLGYIIVFLISILVIAVKYGRDE